MIERFFISGCQRSGTTMLRLVLESHPSIQCFDEVEGYDILTSQSKNESLNVIFNDRAEFVGFKIPRFAEQLLWAEFKDLDYGSFSSFYKDEKVIHIVRNPLDVVGSMMRLKTIGGTSWLERYGLSILQALIKNNNLDRAYKRRYEDLERRGLPIHLVGALYWEIKNQSLFDLQEQGKSVHAVKYETFVESPKSGLLGMCKFLGVDWSDLLLKHAELPHAELDEKGFAIGGTDPRRPIDMESVGSHSHLMTLQRIHEVTDFVEIFSKRLLDVF